ncbi:MAG: hypothetical protein ACTSQS_14270, partial [Promethearchaeota archaeon]
WGTSNESSSYFTGMDYCGGIGQFLLDLGIELSNNYYLNNASLAANWLTSNTIVLREQDHDYYVYYKWKAETSLSEPDFTYSIGGTGALEFLNNIFLEVGTTRYSKYISGGMEWIAQKLNVTDGSWSDKYNLQSGIAGIGYSILKLDLQRPEITASLVPNKLEYNGPLTVYFDVKGIYSNISEVIISYAYGTKYILDIWTIDTLDYLGSDLWAYTFDSIAYSNIYHFVLIAIDDNDSFYYDDNNGLEYQVKLVDTSPLTTKISFLFGDGLGESESGFMTITVDRDISGKGADLDNVSVSIPSLKIYNDLIFKTEFLEVSDEYIAYYEIDLKDKDVKFGDTIDITIITYDKAGNAFIVTDNFDVLDSYPPQANIKEDFRLVGYTQWVPQFIEVEVEAKVIDEESGLDDNKGVFVIYSTDKGETWNTVYLKRKTGDTFSGKIPGQMALIRVYYTLGAEDKQGNYVVWDKYGDETYSDIEDVELKDMNSYQITINWLVLLMIVGVIAAIIVLGYFIYTKRGGYLEQMRRKSKAAASGLAIKEKLTNFYFNLVDKMNSLGEKLIKAKESLIEAGSRFGDKLGEKPAEALKKTGRIIWAVPKGIINGIGSFFRAIGRMIIRTKGIVILLFMTIGALFVLTSVVQFVMEGGYPLRAIFFINLGILMCIIGCVAFIIRGIYKLSYK